MIGIQVCTNEGPRSFPSRDNSEIRGKTLIKQIKFHKCLDHPRKFEFLQMEGAFPRQLSTLLLDDGYSSSN